MGNPTSTRPLSIQVKGKGQGLYHATIKQALRMGVVLADTGVMRTLRVILTNMSDFHGQTDKFPWKHTRNTTFYHS